MTEFDLIPFGRVFYVTGPNTPLVIQYSGRDLFRYMDRIYIPDAPSRLDADTIRDLAELRVMLRDAIIENYYTQSVLDHLCDLATGGKGELHLLDVGCGDGNIAAFALSVAKRQRPREIVGIDICPKIVTVAKERLEVCSLGTAMVIDRERRIPLRSDYFEAAVANFVFHFPTTRLEANEIHRLLLPGGRFVYNDYRFERDPEHFRRMLFTFQSVGFAVESHVAEFRQHFGEGSRIRRHEIVTCTKSCMD